MDVLTVPPDALAEMSAHAYRCFPEEMCGLIVGDRETGRVERFVPVTNTAHSAKLYTIDPKEHLLAERAAEAEGLEVIGVVHSHTHTEAYPSPTDVRQAPDPQWHYSIISLKYDPPRLRNFRIVEGAISETALIRD